MPLDEAATCGRQEAACYGRARRGRCSDFTMDTCDSRTKKANITVVHEAGKRLQRSVLWHTEMRTHKTDGNT
jgi:hypothetical protein